MLSQNLISPWWISFLPRLMGWTILFIWWTLFPKVDEFVFLLDTLLSFLMDFHLSWLDWTHYFCCWWNVSYFFFSSSSSIWLNFFLDESSFLLILPNLNDWISLLMNQYSLKIWWKFLHSLFSLSLFFFFFFFWLKSFLAW